MPRQTSITRRQDALAAPGSTIAPSPSLSPKKTETTRQSAPVAFSHWTPIYLTSNGAVDVYRWLCDVHVASWKVAGWSVKEAGERPGSLAPHRCQDCTREDQAAMEKKLAG